MVAGGKSTRPLCRRAQLGALIRDGAVEGAEDWGTAGGGPGPAGGASGLSEDFHRVGERRENNSGKGADPGENESEDAEPGQPAELLPRVD